MKQTNGIERARTITTMTELDGNLTRFRKIAATSTRVGSPRSRYLVRMKDGKPQSLVLLPKSLKLQDSKADSEYIDAKDWLDEQYSTRTEADGVPPARGTV